MKLNGLHIQSCKVLLEPAYVFFLRTRARIENNCNWFARQTESNTFELRIEQWPSFQGLRTVLQANAAWTWADRYRKAYMHFTRSIHAQTDRYSLKEREGERERKRQRDKRSTAQDIIIWRDKRFPAVHISQHSAGSEADDVIGHVTHHSQVRLPPDTPIWSSPLPLLISEESIYFYFRFCFDPLSIFLNRIPFVEKAVAFWLAVIR